GLGLVWFYDLDTRRGQEATPLAVDGVLFTTSAWSTVQAFDGVSGRLLWQFDPKVPLWVAAKACCDAVNRGAAYWNGKVYVGALDGRLIALDAERGYVSAYDAETGALIWRFYTVPGEPGKSDGAVADTVLAKKVLLHAPNNGFFYVIDRLSGKLISAKPYAKVTWASGIDLATGRPLINPAANYSRTGKQWVGYPYTGGAHGWQSMAYSPQTALVYFPTVDIPQTFGVDPHFERLPVGLNVGIEFGGVEDPPVDPSSFAALRAAVAGRLIAWDPVAQREVWRVPLPGSFNGGALATAGGLVFQGDMDGKLHAYDASNGRRLWSFDAQTAISAAPISWSYRGRQFITVVVGWGASAALGGGPTSWDMRNQPRVNRSRVLTFALGGSVELPPATELPPRRLEPPAQFAGAQTVELGRRLYARSCFGCHGVGAMSGGVIADLRYSTYLADRDAWYAVVGAGALRDLGMIGFKENYSAQQIDAIRAYVIHRAQLSARYLYQGVNP
ncbi:MAG: PQQ-binding-like beta-propeller repeat protein, partial [Steroidobacteraceae bacterium]|nr:PQQ-binding-like beta-propeller repeat protein [Steroidobacteraceae bacterium]MDW8260271.1 PQQ-binding-like beta-propeller repeat protein [Gammaproteobacteria bacterium]